MMSLRYFKYVLLFFICSERLSAQVSNAESFNSEATSFRPELGCRIHTMGLHLEPVVKEYSPHERLACAVIGETSQLTEMERIEIKEILRASLDKFNATVSQLTEAQLNFRPAPNKWTIAECIEHITLAELEFPKILERALQMPADPGFRRKIKIADKDIRPKMISRRWKARSPEVFKPSNRFANTEQAISAFRAQRNSTIAYTESTEDDLRNHFWRHPLTGVIDLYQTLILMSAHLERHIAQMEDIKLTEGFPNN